MSNAFDNWVAATIERMGGEVREPQMKMLNEIVAAISENRPAIIEAPTGTGKSLGYSLPAIFIARTLGKRVLIVTRTKKLQDQLARDLPRYIEAALQQNADTITWATLKGRNHFTCQNRVEKSEYVPVTLSGWIGMGGGSKDEAPSHSAAEWSEVSGGEDCTGKKCRYFQECPGTVQRLRAAEANIVIANQTLLAMNLALGSRAIPGDFDLIIVDEAQHFEDSLRDRLTNDLTPSQLTKANFPDCADALNAILPKFNYEFHPGIETDSIFYDTYVRASAEAKKLENKVKNADEPKLSEKKELIRLKRVVTALWSFTHPEEYVLWVDAEGMHSSPIDVKSIIKEEVGNTAVILTSATIPDNFGLDQPVINVGGGYTNAGLYIANIDGSGVYKFRENAANETFQMIDALNGRTLGLYTSEKAMMDMYFWLKNKLNVNVYHQNQSGAIENFKHDEHAVLLGIDTCWEGIDIPGSSLSLVIIDRIPFPNAKDPLYVAAVEREGWYKPSFIPARTMFRQGCGRLLRKSDDVGIIAVLDNRLITKGYGSALVNSIDAQRIPDLKTTLNLLRSMHEEYDGVTA